MEGEHGQYEYFEVEDDSVQALERADGSRRKRRLMLAGVAVAVACIVAVVLGVVFSRDRHSSGSDPRNTQMPDVEAGEAGSPAGWKLHSVPAAASDKKELIFAVAHKNMDQVEAMLLNVSDPTNPQYGDHKSSAQINQLTANPEATQAVLSFIRSHGGTIKHQSKHGHYIIAEADVQTWEGVFSTKFRAFRHESGKQLLRAHSFSLPGELSRLLSGLWGISEWPLPQPSPPAPSPAPTIPTRNGHGSQGGSTSNPTVLHDMPIPSYSGEATSPWPTNQNLATPDHLKAYYGVQGEASTQVSQAVFESGNIPVLSDLRNFESSYSLGQATVVPGKCSYYGYNAGSEYSCTQTPIAEYGECPYENPNDCTEANLDVQYITAVAPGTTTKVYDFGKFFDIGFWATSMEDLEDDELPSVISMSYGVNEGPHWQQSQYDMFNTEAMKLGLRGVSILVASGDGGASGRGAFKCGYHSSFPASSPYVTAVGATQGVQAGPDATQTVCECATGGGVTSQGGFSEYFQAPSYQKDAINSYFQNVDTLPIRGYPIDGRGTPDVAAQGAVFPISLNGELLTVDGTSAATPTFAGMVTLINARRVAAGKSTLGFLNTALYQNPDAFTDITQGFNGGGEGSSKCIATTLQKYGQEGKCQTGFYAAKGWDPATGLGTPIFQALAARLEALPNGKASPSLPVTPPTTLPYTPSSTVGSISLGASSMLGGMRFYTEVSFPTSSGTVTQQMMIDSGSSTASLCDSSLEFTISATKQDSVSCNLYGTGSSGYNGYFYQGSMSVDGHSMSGPFALMRYEQSMPCVDGYQGIFGIAYKGLAQFYTATQWYGSTDSYQSSQNWCKTAESTGAAGLYVDPLIKALHGLSAENMMWGLHWNGQTGANTGQLYIGENAKNNSHYTSGTPQVTQMYDADGGDGAWMYYSVQLTAFSVGSFRAPVGGWNGYTQGVIDTGTPIIMVPYQTYEALQNNPSSVLHIELIGPDQNPITLSLGTGRELLSNQYVQSSSSLDQQFIIGFPLWKYYYTVIDIDNKQMSFVPNP